MKPPCLRAARLLGSRAEPGVSLESPHQRPEPKSEPKEAKNGTKQALWQRSGTALIDGCLPTFGAAAGRAVPVERVCKPPLLLAASCLPTFEATGGRAAPVARICKPPLLLAEPPSTGALLLAETPSTGAFAGLMGTRFPLATGEPETVFSKPGLRAVVFFAATPSFMRTAPLFMSNSTRALRKVVAKRRNNSGLGGNERGRRKTVRE